MRRLPALLLALCAFSWQVHAQIVSGTILGTVTDASSAALPQAQVTVTNAATGLSRSTATNATGDYVFPLLPPGQYALSATAAGFKKYDVTSVTLPVSQTVRVDMRLEVGTVTQEIEVQATGVQIETETSSLGQVINSQRIVELPLNGRNFMQLANISSGVAPAYNSRSATITNQSGRSDLAVHISGGRGDSNSFLIDGVETRSSWFNSPSILLSVDAVQEFKVDKNLFAAEYGQGSGLVSLVSKSGSNGFHGDAYEFVRNDKFDAANFFDNYFSNRKAPFRQNQYGLTAGGPVIKNKLFFFGNWEALRSRRSRTVSALVPTASQLGGDLTGLPSTKKDGSGATVLMDPYSNVPFPGMQIPASRISTVTKNFNQFVPGPNASVTGQNFVGTRTNARDDDQYGFRIDYQLSGSDTLFGRYTNATSFLTSPGIGVYSGSQFPYDGRNLVLQETHVFSPQLLNVFKFGYNRANVFNSWVITPNSLANQIGLKINQVPDEYGLPGVSVTGGWYVGGGAGINQGVLDDLYQFSDTISYVRGKHTWKAGADIRILRPTQRLGLSNNGSFTFDGRYTGNPLGDYLLGTTAAMNAQIGLGVAAWRSSSYNFFISDDWKITSRLTLNLGLRYEYDQPVWEKDGKEGFFDTSSGKYVVRISEAQSPIKNPIPGLSYQPDYRKGIWNPDRNNFAPRFGLAYRITEKSVLRGGYGLFYSKTQGNEWQFKVNSPPLVFGVSLPGNINTPNRNWDRDAFPDPASPDFPVSTLSPFSVDPRDRTPYIQQWNLTLDQALPRGWRLELGYAGSKGTKLAERVNINQGVLPDPANPTPLADRRRFPNFGDILSSNWQENSNYNALQSKIERRFSDGSVVMAAYTWGHAIDTASRGSGGSWHQDAYHLRTDRGNSDFDVRHRLVASYVYQLPFGKGQRFLSGANPVLNQIAGGWSINGIASFMTGNYFTVTVPGDRANVGGYPFQRANRSCDGNLSHGDRTIGKYFDTSCFALTPLGTFGNGGRNVVQIPGLNNWDISFLKNFPITESMRLQFRAEFFNMFNHAQFAAPDMNVASQFFGQVRSAYDARISQLALKFYW